MCSFVFFSEFVFVCLCSFPSLCLCVCLCSFVGLHFLRKPAGRLGEVSSCERSENRGGVGWLRTSRVRTAQEQ